jgi:hypothetical protein
VPYVPFVADDESRAIETVPVPVTHNRPTAGDAEFEANIR